MKITAMNKFQFIIKFPMKIYGIINHPKFTKIILKTIIGISIISRKYPENYPEYILDIPNTCK